MFHLAPGSKLVPLPRFELQGVNCTVLVCHDTYSLSDFSPGLKNGIDMDSKLAAAQDLGPNSVLLEEIPWINYGLYKSKTKQQQ